MQAKLFKERVSQCRAYSLTLAPFVVVIASEKRGHTALTPFRHATVGAHGKTAHTEEEMQKVEVVEMEEELDPGQVVTSMDPHLEVHQTSEDMAGIMVHLEPIPAPSDPGNYRPPSNELELVMGGLGCCDRRRFN